MQHLYFVQKKLSKRTGGPRGRGRHRDAHAEKTRVNSPAQEKNVNWGPTGANLVSTKVASGQRSNRGAVGHQEKEPRTRRETIQKKCIKWMDADQEEAKDLLKRNPTSPGRLAQEQGRVKKQPDGRGEQGL